MSNSIKAPEEVEQLRLFPDPWDITESLMELLKDLEKDFYKGSLLSADMLGLGHQAGYSDSTIINFAATEGDND